jgi:16S rRNA (cytosine967-C5)-methyltransferase
MNEKRLQQQLRTFGRILENYQFQEPLSRFLTTFYKDNRQMGSTDRRTASRLIYHYFRLGRALPDLPVEKRLAAAELLCAQDDHFLRILEPSWLPHVSETQERRIGILHQEFGFELNDIFPFADQISDGIDVQKFLLSHFNQPRLFIRIHRGKEKRVKTSLAAHSISYEELEPGVLAFANGIQLNRIPLIEGTYEVQDYSSQRTSGLFLPSKGEDWWDACAGSGGKSILLYQMEPGVNITVSDVRNSILRNLDERFSVAGIKHYRRKIVDLSTPESDVLQGESFDGIIVDAPCSGSGTWGRTPEQLLSFTADKLAGYSGRQQQILRRAVKHLKTGKPLIYITCSVYTKENEDQVEFIKSLGLELETMNYYQGADFGADTLFAARFISS